MTRSRGLHFTWLILLLTQFSSINSFGQNSLLKTALEAPNNVKDDITSTSSTSIATEEHANVPAPVPPEPTALSTRDPRKFGLVDRAYLDAFTILNDDNTCSRFFGGRNAIKALTEMVLQLKPRYLDHSVAIRMSGATTLIQSHSTGFTFRLFDKMELNLGGSFFRSSSPWEKQVSITPLYPPNTRETRVIVLLHELGHLVRTSDKKWLLSDDGDDSRLSLDNTARVISVCRQQIASLDSFTAAQELELTSVQKIAGAPSLN